MSESSSKCPHCGDPITSIAAYKEHRKVHIIRELTPREQAMIDDVHRAESRGETYMHVVWRYMSPEERVEFALSHADERDDDEFDADLDAFMDAMPRTYGRRSLWRRLRAFIARYRYIPDS